MVKRGNKLLFIFILICINVTIFLFYDFFSSKISNINLIYKDYIYNNDNSQISNLKDINKKYITVKNAESEPDTLAEIIVQNRINYIPKISVIIPVYNSQHYLDKCLETVINQSLKEIEIICIDDGSIDDSIDILIKYSNKDPRITVLKQNNIHAGVARNAGLLIAKGKYLSFIDSDDFIELNMLEEMYNKIKSQNADIIICQCKTFDSETRKFDEKKFDSSLKINLIPKKEPFSVNDISNNIFQFCLGWAWDKLFRTDFIRANNIRFQNIMNINDQQFTYTALCLANKITTIKKRLVIKRLKHKNSISANKNKDPTCYLSSFDKIKSNLEKKGLFNLVKESFWKNFNLLNIYQLKTLNQESKLILYNALHKKLNLINYMINFPPTSNEFKALHYIKYHDTFPTINIAYVINHYLFDLCVVSILSLLINSEYENINIILLYKNITQKEIIKINELKEIRNFTYQLLYISDEKFNNYTLHNLVDKETWFRCILADKFPNIDKILYIDSDTIIMKSLSPLWEINLNNNLIAAVEDISKSKDNAKKENLKDNLYVNIGVLLINTKKWREINFLDKIYNYIKINKNEYFDFQKVINILADNHKIRLNPEFNYMKISLRKSDCQYDLAYLESYKKNEPTIVHYKGIKPKNNKNKNIYRKEFSKYYNMSKNLKNSHITIPIVLSSDDEYAPFMYTTILSILENAYKTTFYVFFLLVPSNFSNSYQNLIQKLNDNYKCYIHFIFIEHAFEKIVRKIPRIAIPTFYRLIIADVIPEEFDKCIYLDVDVCVCKDLSELFNIDLKDNYIAGVVAAGHYFLEQKHVKRLNIPSLDTYVNAGMLLMNLKEIRKDNITTKFMHLSKRNYAAQDQDIINIACIGRILTLPPKYNAMTIRLEEDSPLYSQKEINEAKKSPHIIHYADTRKPWNSLGVYMESYWWQIAKKTPFINSLFDRTNIYKDKLKNWWFQRTKKPLNIDNPTTFNEKIQWLKLYDSTPIKTQLADKYLVRRWIKDKIGDDYLIPLLGVYKKFEEIDFKNLPNKFVIKCNHGSGYNIIVKDKTKLKMHETKIKIDKWMKQNYAFKFGFELHYRDIEPRIIIEKFMDDGTGDIRDYKFHCFGGKPKFIWIDCDRHSAHKRNLYDLNWNQLPFKVNLHYKTCPKQKKPKLLNKMITLSSILSKGFAYTRVDFYIINDKIYFGELTFTSSSGTEEIKPDYFEKKLSSFINLPKLAYNLDSGEYYSLDDY